MGKLYNWSNPDGLVIRNGPRTTDNNVATVTATEGRYKEIEMLVDVADPAAPVVVVGGAYRTTALSGMATTNSARIPANAIITSCLLSVETTLSGGSVAQPVNAALYHGTTGALVTASLGTNVTALTAGQQTYKVTSLAAGVVGTEGALIGLTVTTGVPTAGKVRISVQYIVPSS
jgi:hypothetical protein